MEMVCSPQGCVSFSLGTEISPGHSKLCVYRSPGDSSLPLSARGNVNLDVFDPFGNLGFRVKNHQSDNLSLEAVHV